MNRDVEPADWESLDPWWTTYARPKSLAGKPNDAGVVAHDVLTQCWMGIDPWWTVFAETGHETGIQLLDLLKQSNEEWATSESPFDTDPLSADLTGKRISRGPLRPSGEVAWSRWLGRLLSPSEALISECFGLSIGNPPFEVIWEDQLAKQEGGYRRPDILIFGSDYGLSIEVKIGDENYRKTAETARLVERHYPDTEWFHVLLLPKVKRASLESIVQPDVLSTTDGQLQIHWDDPGPIDVVYWQNVTMAIRSVLLSANSVDDHWAANAYLFCTLAEQRILNFSARPVVEQLADPMTVVDTIQPIRIADSLEEQLTYLSERCKP